MPLTASDSTILAGTRVRLTEDFPMEINACLDVLSDEQLWWRANEESNSIANLVIHLVGSNHYYLEHLIDGQPLDRDRDGEFGARETLNKAALRSLWEASVARTAGVLSRLDPARLGDIVVAFGKERSIERVLLHVSHHNALHMGQIIIMTKLLAGGTSVADLWKKTRAF